MASGNYARRTSLPAPIELAPSRVPARATRALTQELPETLEEDLEIQTEINPSKTTTQGKPLPSTKKGNRQTTSTQQTLKMPEPTTETDIATETITTEKRAPRKKKTALQRPIPVTDDELTLISPSSAPQTKTRSKTSTPKTATQRLNDPLPTTASKTVTSKTATPKNATQRLNDPLPIPSKTTATQYLNDPFPITSKTATPKNATQRLNDPLPIPSKIAATQYLNDPFPVVAETITQRPTQQITSTKKRQVKTDGLAEKPQFQEKQHKRIIFPWILCIIFVVTTLGVALFAGIYHRAPEVSLLNWSGGKSYDIQVGGTLEPMWVSNNQPMPIATTIIKSSGPYAVLGKPTLTAAFIDQVLSAYHSPAAGTGTDLYNMGVTYQIDPAFALAFFLHESGMGTQGMATITKSLGNLRCIDGAACVNNAGGTCGVGDSCYASFNTWQDGYLAWYKLIRNYYVASRGLTTVPTIIPVYAPPSDGNNDNGYIASVEHEIDTWHAGQLVVD